MRRLVYWIIPLAFSLLGLGIFAAGFGSFVAGRRGEPVDFAPKATRPVVQQKKVAAVVLGDSLARGAGDEAGLGIGGRLDRELKERSIASLPATNIAVNGARTADLLRQLDSANVRRLLAESNVIIISIGGNDLWGDNDWQSAPPDPEAVMGDVLLRVERIVARVRAENTNGRIFIVGLYNPFRGSPVGDRVSPLVARWNSHLIGAFANDANIEIVQTADLFSHRDRLSLDRFHPNGEAYGLIARRIADAL